MKSRLMISCLMIGCLVIVLSFTPPARTQTSQALGTITVGWSPDITSADPQVSNELPPLYLFVEGLTSTTPKGEVVPFLARSWSVSGGGRVYTFKLRPNVLFHNGRKLTPEDVKFSMERVANPQTGAFRQADMRLVQSIEVVDTETVRITLADFNAAFPALLAGVFIIAPESVGADGKVRVPIGTGPFEFSEWVTGDRLVLKRFPRYWQPGIPRVDRVVVRVMNDENARINALRAGDVDIVPTVSPQFTPLLASPEIKIETSTSTIYSHITFNMRNPQGPLKDVRVRRAIAYAIDKSQLVRARVSPTAVVVNQTYRQGELWYVPNLPDEFAKPNLDKARALLREAGVGEFPVELITLRAC